MHTKLSKAASSQLLKNSCQKLAFINALKYQLKRDCKGLFRCGTNISRLIFVPEGTNISQKRLIARAELLSKNRTSAE